MHNTHHTPAADLHWFKSTYSGQGGTCVEVADARPTHSSIAVRDSKNPGPHLLLNPGHFTAFIDHVRTT